MLGASLEIDLSEVHESIAEKLARLGAMGPLMERIGALLLLSSQMRIESTKKGPSGSAWAPLARATIRRRTKDGTIGGGTLRISGALVRSLNYNANDSQVVVSIGSSGKSMDYARIHQLGGTIERSASQKTLYLGASGHRWVKKSQAQRTKVVDVGAYTITIPARPVLGLSEEDKADILEEVDSFLGAGGEE
jgi:phage virion morphogenesis protein